MSSAHQPECRMESYTTEIGPQNSVASYCHFIYRFLWSLHSHEMTSWHLVFVPQGAAFKALWKKFASTQTIWVIWHYKTRYLLQGYMCVNVLFLKAKFLLYTTPNPTQPKVYVSVYDFFFDNSSIIPYHTLDLMLN